MMMLNGDYGYQQRRETGLLKEVYRGRKNACSGVCVSRLTFLPILLSSLLSRVHGLDRYALNKYSGL